MFDPPPPPPLLLAAAAPVLDCAAAADELGPEVIDGLVVCEVFDEPDVEVADRDELESDGDAEEDVVECDEELVLVVLELVVDVSVLELAGAKKDVKNEFASDSNEPKTSTVVCAVDNCTSADNNKSLDTSMLKTSFPNTVPIVASRKSVSFSCSHQGYIFLPDDTKCWSRQTL